MRIKIMDQVFAFIGLGAIVAQHVEDPNSNHIRIEQVVEALHKEQHEEGVQLLFKNCIQQFSLYTEENRRDQVAEAAVRCFKILKGAEFNADEMMAGLNMIRQSAEKYDVLYRKIIQEPRNSAIVEERIVEMVRQEVPEADEWLKLQNLSFTDIATLAADAQTIELLCLKTQEWNAAYSKKNGLTKNDGKIEFAKQSLHGIPFDHNRLGKSGEIELIYEDGSRERKNSYHPGFERFYVAGSPIKMEYGTYDLMQAPIRPHSDKVDTVQDFWDSVVVLRKSPIIVTVHDPDEKIPRYGYPQRAEYWAKERFDTPMKLRNGWELSREGDDVVVATSVYYEGIRLVKRTFIATNQETKETHQVTQFHYQGWPDHCGAPDIELFVKLLDAVDSEIEKRDIAPEAPITAHCAAGQGRSPAFAIAHLLRREAKAKLQAGEAKEQIMLNLPRAVYEFNTQRPSQLGNTHQWQTVLLALRRFHLSEEAVDLRPVEEAFESLMKQLAAQDLQDAINKREAEARSRNDASLEKEQPRV